MVAAPYIAPAARLDSAGGYAAFAPQAECSEAVAIEQIKALISRLHDQEAVPSFFFGTGHDSVKLAEGLREASVGLPVRLRFNRCCDASPLATAPSSISGTRRADFRFARPCVSDQRWPRGHRLESGKLTSHSERDRATRPFPLFVMTNNGATSGLERTHDALQMADCGLGSGFSMSPFKCF